MVLHRSHITLFLLVPLTLALIGSSIDTAKLTVRNKTVNKLKVRVLETKARKPIRLMNTFEVAPKSQTTIDIDKAGSYMIRAMVIAPSLDTSYFETQIFKATAGPKVYTHMVLTYKNKFLSKVHSSGGRIISKEEFEGINK